MEACDRAFPKKSPVFTCVLNCPYYNYSAHKCKLNRHCTVLKYYYNKIKHNLPSLSFKLMTKDRRPSALSPGKIIAAAIFGGCCA